jgi:hypothetical protein
MRSARVDPGARTLSRARQLLSEHTDSFVQNVTLQDYAIIGLNAFLCWKALVDTPYAVDHVRAETVALCLVAACTAILVRGELLAPGPARALVYRIGMFGSIMGSYFTLRVLLAALQPKLLDAQLLAIDTRLFGTTPAAWLDQFVTPGRVEWFAFFYFGYYWLLGAYLVGTLLLDRGQRRYELLLGATLVAAIGHTTYTLVPGVGPWAYSGLTFQHQLMGGHWWDRVLGAVTSAGAQLDIFPSLHTGFSTLIALHAIRYRRVFPIRAVWLGTVFAVANIIGATLFLRWHYGVDVIAGLILAWTAQRIAIVSWRIEGQRNGGSRDQSVWESVLPDELIGADRDLVVGVFTIHCVMLVVLVLCWP